ncbi:hypothetical protein ABK040_003121 [Willaertia magna]
MMVANNSESDALARTKSSLPTTKIAEYISFKPNDKIRIKILRAEDLVNDKNGVADPYINIFVKGFEQISTDVAKRTLNPIWNEEFTFNVKQELTGIEVVFKVMDKDFLGVDDFMGGNVLYLTKEQFPHFNEIQYFHLDLQGVKQGSIYVGIGVYKN